MKNIGGNYNYTSNSHIDRGVCQQVNQDITNAPVNKVWIKPIIADKGANDVLLEMMESRGIDNIWHRRNPDMKKITWSHIGKNVAARIDY